MATQPRTIPIGETFGELTVLSFSSYHIAPCGDKVPLVVCSCSCGATRVANLLEVRRGRMSHCGNKLHRRKSKGVDYRVGEVYGRLTVLEASPSTITPGGREVSKIKCQCDCGKELVVGLWDIRSGKTTTCGDHPLYEDRSLPAFNNLYRHTYRGRALASGRVFELTEDQFRALTQQDCFYCGAGPRSKSVQSGKYISEYIYNGIDSVDNTLGYTIDN